MRVMILQGLPASGKTHFSKTYCEKNPSWVRVNRDDLRNMRGRYWIPEQESLITKWEEAIIGSALVDGYNVIIDSTNLNPKYLKRLKNYLTMQRVDYSVKFFDTDVEECIKRDLKRENSVGHKVIREMHRKYLQKPQPKLEQDEKLPKAVIYDLDGSMCLMNGRSPYDSTKYDTDLPNPHVVELAQLHHKNGYKIIFLSGREGTELAKSQTYTWLKEHAGIGDDWVLFMRKEGDFRKDYIVKEEIFMANVKDKYHVRLVIDDRLQVVRRWYDLGLPILRVGDPDANF